MLALLHGTVNMGRAKMVFLALDSAAGLAILAGCVVLGHRIMTRALPDAAVDVDLAAD